VVVLLLPAAGCTTPVPQSFGDPAVRRAVAMRTLRAARMQQQERV
jgi:hypothetical protein